jgi:hypothetical protein
MGQFYNPKRGSDWNYGGRKWRLSRSKIDLFTQCPRCFYIDNKLGTKRVPGFPFNLNSAVDLLLKKEFDLHRAQATPHPLMDTYSLKMVPFQHENMDTWRENFEGVETKHKATGLTVCGAVDDVWVSEDGKLSVVDYKSTSKDGEIKSLDAEWQDGYKRQMEVYQWLLRQNGFDVSDTGYFVYANGRQNNEAFNGVLEFDINLIAHTGSDDWIDAVLGDIKSCLESDELPPVGKECDYCPYHYTRNEREAKYE